MRKILVCSILLTLVVTSSLQAQKYVVHLTPYSRAGQKYTVSSSGSTLNQVSLLAGEHVVWTQTKEYEVTFNGQAEVLAADEAGQPLKIAFTVERLTKTEGGVITDLLKSGSVILTDGSQEKPISLKEGTIDESVREAFVLVQPPHQPGGPTDDEVFGTPEAKGIGDSWSINLALASIEMENSGVPITAEWLTGAVSLVGKDKVAGVECLSLLGEMKGRIVLRESPPNTVLDRGTMEATIRGCYSQGGSGPLSFKEGADGGFQIQLTRTKDTPMEGATLELKTHQKHDSVWETLKN